MLSVVIPVWNERQSLQPLHAEIMAVAHRGPARHGSAVHRRRQYGWIMAGHRRPGEALRIGPRHSLSPQFRQGGGAVGGVPRRPRRHHLHSRRRPAGRPRRDSAFPHRPGAGWAERLPLDVVSGWKRVRHDPWHKVFPSRVFNCMVSRLTGVQLHDHNCGMKATAPRSSARSASTASCTASSRCWPPPAASASARSRSTIGPASFGHSKYGVAPIPQGLSRPADRQVPDRLRPAAAAPAGQLSAVQLLARQRRHALPGRHLDRHATMVSHAVPAAARTAAADLFSSRRCCWGRR